MPQREKLSADAADFADEMRMNDSNGAIRICVQLRHLRMTCSADAGLFILVALHFFERENRSIRSVEKLVWS
jgi:hypothetical protein